MGKSLDWLLQFNSIPTIELNLAFQAWIENGLNWVKLELNWNFRLDHHHFRLYKKVLNVFNDFLRTELNRFELIEKSRIILSFLLFKITFQINSFELDSIYRHITAANLHWSSVFNKASVTLKPGAVLPSAESNWIMSTAFCNRYLLRPSTFLPDDDAMAC